MRRTVPVTLLALSALVPGTAHAAAGPGEGSRCGFTSVSNRFADDRQTGWVYGGPIVLADGFDPRAGRIRCTIQVNAFDHTGADAVSVASVTTPAVAVLPLTPIEYDAADTDVVVLCTQVEIVGAGTFYWDGEAHKWSTSPHVSCAIAIIGAPRAAA